MRIIATAILMLPGYAFANPQNLPFDCVAAISSGDENEINRIADEIKGLGSTFTSIGKKNAAKCLEAATGTFHRYDADINEFVPDEVAGKQLKQKQEREKKAAAEREKAAAIARGDKEVIEAELLRQAREAKSQREMSVYSRLVEGCESKYQRDPDETITNKLCFDVFINTGLPE